MKTDLIFDNADTKKLLTKLDFEYFLQRNIGDEKYPQTSIDLIYASFNRKSVELKERARENRAQLHLYAEGQVRKMFTGGLLTTLFHLNDMRKQTLVDFVAIGDNWAYFNHWQKRHKSMVQRQRAWSLIVPFGSVLAIVLALLKVLEYVGVLHSPT